MCVFNALKSVESIFIVIKHSVYVCVLHYVVNNGQSGLCNYYLNNNYIGCIYHQF